MSRAESLGVLLPSAGAVAPRCGSGRPARSRFFERPLHRRARCSIYLSERENPRNPQESAAIPAESVEVDG